MIDPRAIIDPSAKIAANVSIGPYTVIGPRVEIGEATQIAANVVIKENAKIGAHNIIHSFASIAGDPQSLKYKGQEAWLYIGDHNVFREFCTINRGSDGDSVSTIGSHNLFMSYAHVAHDCKVGNHNVFANSSTLAGHVTVHDHVSLGGAVLVHQFCNIGSYSFVGGASALNQDVIPYITLHGVPAGPISVNVIGLRRHGFSEDVIAHIRHAYKILFRRGLKLEEAKAELEKMARTCSEIQLIVDLINNSTRGVARPNLRVKQEEEA